MSYRDKAFELLSKIPPIVPEYRNYLTAVRCCSEEKAKLIVEFAELLNCVNNKYQEALKINDKKECTRTFKLLQDAWKSRPKIAIKRLGKEIII